MGPTEYAVVALVVGARFVLHLSIPYYPIVGIVACLILDAIDQSIFQQFPKIPLDGYQQYDKALDIYYLAIAYLATMRNWNNMRAFNMSMFLYYYRLVGVVAFELTQVRALLLIFPNTFEYFFIFFEGVRMRWNAARVGKWTVIVATVLIWVFIKLPQEWWIHIAKLDMADFIKESLFGVSADTSWSEAIRANPMVVVVAAAVLALLLAVVWWIIARKAPPADHRLKLSADPLPPQMKGAELYRTVRAHSRVFDAALVEKAILLALISVIFAQITTDLEASNLGIAGAVAVFVAVNATVSQWLARRGRAWDSVAVEFAAMSVINLGIVFALELVERILGGDRVAVPFTSTLFLVALLTVLIVLFDRYHTVHRARLLVLEASGGQA